ncbi:MAG: squalene/phytoene synthase family protein [Gammaproteobacteria bacterium]
MNAAEEVRHKLAAAPIDLRLAVQFSPREQRDALTALFAVYLEIREIPLECSDAGVARTKLAWWQEEISLLAEHKSRHPLTQYLAQCIGARPLPTEPCMEIIAGAHTDVSTFAFPHFEDVERYCYRCGGALMELAALLAGAQQPATLDAARRLGIAWQLANIVVTTPTHAQHGRVYFATDDLHKHGVDRHIVGEAHTGTGLEALLADYAQRARAFADAAASAPLPEPQAMVAARVLNSLAQARLKKFEWLDYKLSGPPVKLRPFAALFTAWRSARYAVLLSGAKSSIHPSPTGRGQPPHSGGG